MAALGLLSHLNRQFLLVESVLSAEIKSPIIQEALAIIGGHVEEELLLRNEYLTAEDEIMRPRVEGCLHLTNREGIRLAKIAERLGRKGLEGVPCIVKPDTLLRSYRDLVAEKLDGSNHRKRPGRPRRS